MAEKEKVKEEATWQDYSTEYSESSFWDKVAAFAIKAGKELLDKALILYYCLQDSATPAWAKTVIVSALGYFVMPLDAIPDTLPAVGYADDLGVVVMALGMVAAHVKPEHKTKAEEKWKVWFG